MSAAACAASSSRPRTSRPGKTTVAIGLAAALRAPRARGPDVQEGPGLHRPDVAHRREPAAAAATSTRTSPTTTEIRATLPPPRRRRRRRAGRGQQGALRRRSRSTAATAMPRWRRCSALPVVLVLDARGMTRGIAPLILGYQAFDRDAPHRRRDPQPAGRQPARGEAARGDRALHRRAGARRRPPRSPARDRRATPRPDAVQRNGRRGRATSRDIAAPIARQVDVDRLLRASPPIARPRARAGGDRAPRRRRPEDSDIRIGIAQDRAFGFYYADDLDALRAAGATLVAFDTLADAQLPDVDALFIGGGFPELLRARARGQRRAARRASAPRSTPGLPVYAECGGLMYLARSLTRRRAHVPDGRRDSRATS